MSEQTIELGAMAPKLQEQLKGNRISQDNIDLWQMDADAITRLHLRGFISEAVTEAARKKLVSKIQKEFARL